MSDDIAPVRMPRGDTAHGVLARELAEAAAAVRGAGREAAAVLSDPLFLRSLLRRPVSGARSLRALGRALARRDGLGYTGGAGAVAGRRGLGEELAVASLRLRLGGSAELAGAVAAGDSRRAGRILRRPVAGGGGLQALAGLVAEADAWGALTDRNPFNDAAAWAVVTGRPADPVRRPKRARVRRRLRPLAARRRCARLPGVCVTPPRPGGIGMLLRGLGTLGYDGRLAVLRVRAGDGVERYVALLPGRDPGSAASPRALCDAVAARAAGASAYVRGAHRALGEVLPLDAEVALVGHGAGGVVAMCLAGTAEVNDAWQVTHVVAVGAPLGPRRAYDPRTQVISLVNEHDVVPGLAGRGPVPAEWVSITWADPSYDFPVSHGVGVYADNLERLVPEERDRVDAMLADYVGSVLETAVFRLPAA
ncbi:hypothetical protein [Streptomyces smaragdinus]|nr:hypothetical protein [Streptomyces smaragdinus]